MSKLTDERLHRIWLELTDKNVISRSAFLVVARAIEAELSAAPASQNDWNAAIEAAYRAADNVLPFKDEKQRNPANVRNEILNAINSLVRPAAQQEQDKDALLQAAVHALRSYQYGNSSGDLAESVADKIDAAIGSKQP